MQLDDLGDLSEVWSGAESFTAVAFSPESDKLAAGTADGKILVFDAADEGFDQSFVLESHTLVPVANVDWSSDGRFLRTNGADFSTLYWSVEEEARVEDGEEIDDIGTWDSQRCTVTFETIGIWPIRKVFMAAGREWVENCY